MIKPKIRPSTTAKISDIAREAKEFEKRKPEFRNYPNNVFFNYLMKYLIKKDEEVGTNLVGKKASWGTLYKRASEGGFKRKKA
jgi:hypothetical protein